MDTGMSSPAPLPGLRRLFESSFSRLSAEAESLVAEAQEHSRRKFADQLNQAVRRVCQSGGLAELARTLVDAAAGFATGAALFRIENDAAQAGQVRGVPDDVAAQFADLEIPLSAAPALAGAVGTRDPVIAAAAPSEVSERLVTLLGHSGETRAFVYPILLRAQVPAVLYAWGKVESPALEILAQVGASAWAELSRPVEAPFVQIAPATKAAAPEEPPSAWDRLSPQEQQIHLRAQRFARVRVADIRLHEADAVRAGRSRADIYGVLRETIDAGRETFRKTFFVPCPSMVDYLHLELVRTLANNDAELLGKDYPGPMV
jgi:hypothetical protein